MVRRHQSCWMYTSIGIILFLTCTLITVWNQLNMNWIKHRENEILRDVNCSSDFRVTLSELAVAVHGAKLHVRGTKTSDYLRTAEEKLKKILVRLNIDIKSLLKRREIQAKNVCPEKYMGSTYGYPTYDKGFEEIPCAYRKPIAELVTVLAIDDSSATSNSPEYNSKVFVKSALSTYPNIKIIFATKRKERFADISRDNLSVSFYVNSGMTDGKAYFQMAELVTTPYTLISKTIDFLTNDSRLSRLIRVLESFGVTAVGGAWRDSDGHWTHGCYQSVYRNFTLKYVYGYDESIHECLVCDHMTGPFIIQRKTFLDTFGAFNTNDGLFEYLFLRLKLAGEEMLVCPDSMFHMRNTKKSNELKYDDFMTFFNLYELQTVDGQTFHAECGKNYIMPKTTTLSPCGLNSNAALVKFIMSVCEESNIICELQSGTALGAVKFGKVLPWERDGDITFLARNCTALRKLKFRFEKMQFKFENTPPSCYLDNTTARGKFDVANSDWRIEIWDEPVMDSQILKIKGIMPTKVLFDGQWVNVPRNPGLYVRNRYGNEMYQHAQHWITIGVRNSWVPYAPNIFLKCTVPGSHDCLDRYNSDGSLTFEYILP